MTRRSLLSNALALACGAGLMPGPAGWARAQPAPALPPDVIARVIAGLPPPPGHPVADRLVALPDWAEHRQWVSQRWTQVSRRLDSMRRWRETELTQSDAASRTLVYPFSGPDFLNAEAMFPDHPKMLFFSLERPGHLPEIDKLDTPQFARLLADVRYALSDIFERNYFITSYMTRQLTSPYLRGSVPIIAVMMALSGYRIQSIQRLDPFPNLTREYTAPPEQRTSNPAARPTVPLRGARIAYESPGRSSRTLDYYSLDATDRALRWYPDFPDLITVTQPATVFIKSASYLLHDNQFSIVRDALMSAGDVIVQDDSGVPYRQLLRRGWAVRLYGVYTDPIPPMGYAAQPDLDAAYRAAAPVPPVDFPFGYGGRIGRSSLIVARRGA